MARELDGKMLIGKMNVDQNPATRSELNIMGVPAFFVFKKGKTIRHATGAHSKQQLLRLIGDVIEP